MDYFLFCRLVMNALAESLRLNRLGPASDFSIGLRDVPEWA